MEEAGGPTTCSWLQQVDQNLGEMGMGQASAWGMAGRRPLEYWRKVDAAMHYSGTCSYTRLDLTFVNSALADSP